MEAKRAITIVAGVSGSGKSTFALRYLVNAPLAVRFVFDPDGEYAERLDIEPARDGWALGLAACRGWVLFDPHEIFPGRCDDAFSFFCDWVQQMAERIPGQKILVVEEAWKYVSTDRKSVV